MNTLKKIIILGLLFPQMTFGATAVGWNTPNVGDGYILPNLVNGVNQIVRMVSGFLSMSSSTIVADFRLPLLSQGATYIGTGGLVGSTATTTASCAGSVICNPFTIFGSSPVTITGTGGSGGGIGTTTPWTPGQVAYAVNDFTASSIGTTTLAVNSPLTVTGTLGYLINGTNSTINCQTASGSQAGCLSSTDWTTFNNKQTTLVSGTNIKTINGSSVLGSGDLTVVGATALASSTPWTFGSLVVAKDNSSVTTIATSTLKTSQLTNDAGFLASYDAWTHPVSGKSATTSEIWVNGLLSQASTTIVGNATTTGTHSIGTVKTGTIENTSGVTTISVNSNSAQNVSGVTTLDWQNNLLTDTTGNSSVDWENKQLLYNTVPIVDWINGQVKNTGGIPKLDWVNGLLQDSTGATSIGWNTGNTITFNQYDCSGNTNNGKLTVNASGEVICADDVSGLISYDAWTHPILGQSATTSMMLFGTSTGRYGITSASTTAPQLSLSQGAGILQWVFRNAGGNLYLSTTTVQGLSTTSISTLEVAGSGFGTTTLRGLNIIGQATSTSNVGYNITSGCYAIGGTCISSGGGGGTPGGSDTEIQYNNGGAFGGASALTYDDGNLNLTYNGGSTGGLSFLTNSSSNGLSINSTGNISTLSNVSTDFQVSNGTTTIGSLATIVDSRILQIGAGTNYVPSGGGTPSYLIIDRDNSAQDASILFGTNGQLQWEIGLPGDGDMHWKSITGTESGGYTFTDRLFMSSTTGAVGYGTSQPTGALEVATSAPSLRSQLTVTNKNSGAGSQGSAVVLSNQPGENFYIGTDAGLNGNQNAFINWGGFGTGLFFDSSANLGINTTSITTGSALTISGQSDISKQLFVGTTTGSNYQGIFASSTAPQLSLSAGTGISQWVQRNAGGNFYLSTTTVAGTSTTTISALSINGSTGDVTLAKPLSTANGGTGLVNPGSLSAQALLAFSGSSGASAIGVSVDGCAVGTTGGGSTFTNCLSTIIGGNLNTSTLTLGAKSGLTNLSLQPTGRTGVATTTPNYLLTIASSTEPQLSLSAGAGIAQWTLRNAGGNLYFATTTVVGTSTSTPFFSILNTGNALIGTTTPWLNSALTLVGTTTIKGQIVGLRASTTAASTQNIDWSTGNFQDIMLTSATTNIVMNATSSNPIDGGFYKLRICQDGTGSRAIVWANPVNLRWGSYGTTTISSTANTCTFIVFSYIAVNGTTIYTGLASTTGAAIR